MWCNFLKTKLVSSYFFSGVIIHVSICAKSVPLFVPLIGHIDPFWIYFQCFLTEEKHNGQDLPKVRHCPFLILFYSTASQNVFVLNVNRFVPYLIFLPQPTSCHSFNQSGLGSFFFY